MLTTGSAVRVRAGEPNISRSYRFQSVTPFLIPTAIPVPTIKPENHHFSPESYFRHFIRFYS